MLLRSAACPLPPSNDTAEGSEPRATDKALEAVLAVAAALKVDAEARAELKRMLADAEADCPAPANAREAAADDSPTND
jgi:hypothetical protein